MPRRLEREYLGLFLVIAIGSFASFGFFGGRGSLPSVSGQTSVATHGLTVSGGASGTIEVTNVVVNNASSIILTPNTTTTVPVAFTVSGGNGCGSVFFGGNVTTTLYRSGVSATCGIANPLASNINTLNCYVVTTTTHNCESSTSTASANATATFGVWYFAEATDASSSFSAQDWTAYVAARDSSNGTSTATGTAQELVTLLALHVATSSINYGTVDPNTNTSGTNEVAPIKNAGNASTSLSINGTAMTNGGNSITTSSQHYATSTFTYGGVEQALQEAATAVSGWLVSRPPLANWTSTTDLPAERDGTAAAATESYLYILGGYDITDTVTSSVLFAKPAGTGAIANWSSTTALPSPIGNVRSATDGTRVYITGGDSSGTTLTSTSRFATIHATGSLSSWTNTTPLPAVRSHHGMAVVGDIVYIVAGKISSSAATSSAFIGRITSTGTIAVWSSTTPIPAVTQSFGFGTYNGYLYVVGGNNGGGTSDQTSVVYYAPITATGSIGTWSQATSLPYAVEHTSLIVDNGFVYVAGGYRGPSEQATSTVVFAPIFGNGELGAWSFSTVLPNPRSFTGQGGGITKNGYGYVTGGDNASLVFQKTVYFVPLGSRDTYWGVANPAGTPTGTYSGVNTFTAVFSP